MSTTQKAIRFDVELWDEVLETAEQERRRPTDMVRILVEDALIARRKKRKKAA